MKDTVTISIERFKELERKEQELQQGTKWVELNLGIYESFGFHRDGGIRYRLRSSTDSDIIEIVNAIKESEELINIRLEGIKENNNHDLEQENKQLHEAVLIERQMKNDVLNKLNKIPNWVKKIFV